MLLLESNIGVKRRNFGKNAAADDEACSMKKDVRSFIAI